MRAQPLVIVFILTLLIGGGGAYFYSKSKDSGSRRSGITSEQRKPAPGFELPDVSGKTHRLEDLRGNVVVLHFWASWCPPCIEEIPVWLALAKSMEGQKVKFLAVALDESWEDAYKVWPREGLPTSVISLLDLKKTVPEAYGSFQYPETYLISSELEIVEKWVGPQDWVGQAVRSRIGEYLPK